jgi:hypothetical protein
VGRLGQGDVPPERLYFLLDKSGIVRYNPSLYKIEEGSVHGVVTFIRGFPLDRGQELARAESRKRKTHEKKMLKQQNEATNLLKTNDRGRKTNPNGPNRTHKGAKRTHFRGQPAASSYGYAGTCRLEGRRCQAKA